MKKTKILLTTIGLISVVGGALAFKVNRISGKLWCSTTTSPATLCALAATTLNIGDHTAHNLYCTTDPVASCPVRFRTLYLNN